MMLGYVTGWVTAMYLSMLMMTRWRMLEVQVHTSTQSHMKQRYLTIKWQHMEEEGVSPSKDPTVHHLVDGREREDEDS